MISCTEFILAYSELFKFIHQHYGREAVQRFWEGISDEFLNNLRDLVAEKGLEGMQEYWSHTLGEEGGEWEMKLHGDTFEIFMNKCPSAGKLKKARDAGWLEPYAHYCEHCDTLYRRVIEPFGFDYTVEYLDCDHGICHLIVTKKHP